MIEWPTSLNFLAERGSYQLVPTDPQLRSEFDTGPARMRRRFTTSIPKFTFTTLMTSEEFEIFKAFFYFDLLNGVNWFNIPIWAGDQYVIHEARFTEPYKMADAGFQRVTVNFSLEARKLDMWTASMAYLIGEFGYAFVEDELADPLQIIVNIDYPSVVENY